MKFQLKALAAALVLAAALPAHAAVDTTVSGNSSLILAVYNSTTSALYDLGKNYSDFTIAGTQPNSGVTNLGTSFTWNLNAGDYAAATSAYGNLTGSKYAVIAIDNAGTGAGARGLIGTFAAAGATPTSGTIGSLGGSFDIYTRVNSESEAIYQNHTDVANGASVVTDTASVAYGPNWFLGDKAQNVGPTVAGLVGSDLGLFQYTTAAGSFVPYTFTSFGNGAKFNLSSAGALTYSTNPIITNVPEADTWAMMLLGLSVMGAVARRKQA